MATTIPDDGHIAELRDTIEGDVWLPGDDGYRESTAIWNGMVEKHPAIAVQCRGTDDVVGALTFAREHDIPFSVKGGGHSFPGKSLRDDGMVIDLGVMDDVDVDAETKTATVGPGATWGDFDAEAQSYGLATTGGVDSRTGVSGLTLGGGIGWLARSFGLACDNLLRAEVVTADGSIVTASPDENSDLFWALRGGSGSFGIVTSFEFQLHEVGPEVLVAQAYHPFDDAADMFRCYREFMADAPEEVGCYAFILRIPPMEPFPEEHHGEMAAAMVGCYSGDVEDGREAFAPVTEFGDPILAFADAMPYTAFQQSFDEGYPEDERYYGKSGFIDALSDELIEDLIDVTEDMKGPYTAVFIEALGGAVGRVDPTETAFPHRDAPFNLATTCGWSDPERDDEVLAWATKFQEVIERHATDGVYVNYLDRGDDDRMRSAYQDNLDRLIGVKRRWDPENVFDDNPHLVADR